MKESQRKTSGAQVATTLFMATVLRAVFIFGITMRILLIIFIVFVCAAYGTRYMNNPEAYSLLRLILYFDLNKLCAYVKQVLPTTIGGFDFAYIILITAAVFVRVFFGKVALYAQNYAEYFRVKEILELRKAEMKQSQDQTHLSDLASFDEKLENLKKGGMKNIGKNRVELLKVMDEVQRNLESMKKPLTFLSVDIVDSTSMKAGEDPTLVELDFNKYKGFVEKILKDYGYLKATWTPDGIMCCFNRVNDAVKAARKIIKDLDTFNLEHKRIKRDFIIRCGINSGKVAYDESIPMETMCDGVIDVAGHLQKKAQPGSIYISQFVYEMISDREKFKSTDIVIDGHAVYASSTEPP